MTLSPTTDPSSASRFVTPSRLAFMVIVTVGMALSLLHIQNYPTLSPIDELHHFDNVVKWSAGHPVHRGDGLGEDAMHAVACRSIDTSGFVPPACVPANVPIPSSDPNTAYMHPPLYYAVTGIVARVLRAVGLVPGLLVGARIANGLWFVVGLLLLFAVMGELGLTGLSRIASALVPALIPFAVFQSATVTNDVTAIPSACLVLLAALRFDHGRWRIWVMAATSALAIWLRMTNLFGVAVAVIYLLIRAWQVSPFDSRRYVHAAATSAGAAAAAGLMWILVVRGLARVPASAMPLYQVFPKHFSLGQVFESVAPMVPPTYDLPNVVFWTRHTFVTLLAGAMGWPVIAAPFIGVLRRDRDHHGLALGVAAGTVMLTTGPVLAVINAVSEDSFLAVPFPTRMALSVVPGCLAAAFGGLRSKWSQRLLTSGAAVGLVAMFVIVASY